ncbi:ABC transporter permease [Alkalimonas amylolytica]|uniref:Putative ABC transport system permease protein n=1 Tax=Alkalimonas amylolytica TaxID=152573 RepID=A0A1H4BFA2_ALKAM|nr:ABC transporter permease [Alkalimonas amylolytica]SEA46668.1 putative ABC transport system permease protein [Alkalimonas amylolytica]
MQALQRKLWRDLLAMKGQILAIAAVIGAGVMVLFLAVTTLDMLERAQQRFYQQAHFGDVFVDLTRAPEHLIPQLQLLPGVQQVQSSVRAPVRLEVVGFDDPIRGLMLSLPEQGLPRLNQLVLLRGHFPAEANEVAITEPFANAHQLEPGDQLTAVIQGRLQRLQISAIVLSPEFIYQLGPADLLPDYQRFGVLWMPRQALAHAFQMDGAFNHLSVSLQRGVNPLPVLDALDLLLAPYGSRGSYLRAEQASHRFLTEELEQLSVMAWVLPLLFLGVAAFLLNVLIGRLVRNQLQQIAVLKAFGYSHGALLLHYLQLACVIVVIGVVAGVGLGLWTATGLAELYAAYFHFPAMELRVQLRHLALALLVALLAAMVGVFSILRQVARLQPAAAMRPAVPPQFQRGLAEKMVLRPWLGQLNRIILRNLLRYPGRSLLSVLGIALSSALLLVGSFQFHALNALLDIQYRHILQMDTQLMLSEASPERVLAEIRAEPGVLAAEAFRMVPVRLHYQRTSYRTVLQGLEARPQLRRLLDQELIPIELPAEGLVLTRYLADYLGVKPGDMVQAELMEGANRLVELPLAAVVDEPVGVSGYMERRALNRLLREGPAISGVWLLTDPLKRTELQQRLQQRPAIAGISQMADIEQQLRNYIADTLLGMMTILLLMAISITFAVIYNNARIALAERSRELATLRVLGFERYQVGWVLAGEVLLLTLLAIPLGWLLGTGFAWSLQQALTMDLFRLPFVLEPSSFALAALGVLLATALSLSLMLRRFQQLDMISALKTE